MEKNSAEYRTLKKHTPVLCLAVKSDLTGLGGALFAAELITQEQNNGLRNQERSEGNRSADLIDFIQDKVALGPQNYNTFIGTLEKRDSSHYGGILRKLQQTYDGMFIIIIINAFKLLSWLCNHQNNEL